MANTWKPPAKPGPTGAGVVTLFTWFWGPAAAGGGAAGGRACVQVWQGGLGCGRGAGTAATGGRGAHMRSRSGCPGSPPPRCAPPRPSHRSAGPAIDRRRGTDAHNAAWGCTRRGACSAAADAAHATLELQPSSSGERTSPESGQSAPYFGSAGSIQKADHRPCPGPAAWMRASTCTVSAVPPPGSCAREEVQRGAGRNCWRGAAAQRPGG